MLTWIQSIPAWVGALGCFVMLFGFLMQRKAYVSSINSTSIRGSGNVVNNIGYPGTQSQASGSENKNGDSALSKSADWATIAGFVVGLLPFLKELLAKAT